jgi:microcystin-dependent protein
VSSPYLAEIRMMSFNFPPRGWALCNGQLLPINQNAALFSLMGTTYGGNGVNNFQLPNLQSRVPVHQSASFVIGEVGGAENVQLNGTQLPQHTHLLAAVNAPGDTAKPFGHFLAQSSTAVDGAVYLPPGSGTTTLNPGSLQPTGGGLPHSNIQPYLAVNFSIALQGIFPTRN